MRIAAWSGPRNLSTAMMYAFAARGDCAVWDEPFYAPFLNRTGADHPLRDRILAAHDTDPDRVAQACSGPIPGDRPHFYMKHMPHHMGPGVPMDWAAGCTHLHLVRHPARVVASYRAKRENPTLEDLGYVQQQRLFDRLGGVVVDGTDIRADPAGMLPRLCAALGLDWDPAMLVWPAGGRPEDGAWAPHWYGAVHRSTGFAGPEGPLPALDGAGSTLVEAALPAYRALAAHRLRPTG